MTDETTLTPQTSTQVPAAPQSQTDLSVSDFAKRLKIKFPVYQHLDDYDLTNRVLSKHPQYGKVLAYDPKLVGIAEEDVAAARQRAEQAKLNLQAAQPPPVTPQVTVPTPAPIPDDEIVRSVTTAPKSTPIPAPKPLTFDAARTSGGLNRGFAERVNELADAPPEPMGEEKLLLNKYQDPGTRDLARPITFKLDKDSDPVNAALATLGPEYPKLNQMYRELTGRNLVQIDQDLQPDDQGNFTIQPTRRSLDIINAFAKGVGEGGPQEGLKQAQALGAQIGAKESTAYNTAQQVAAPNIAQLEAERKAYGTTPAAGRAIAQPAERLAAGITKTLGGIASIGGLAPNRVSDYLNTKATIGQAASSLPPLTATGEAIQRSLPEKAAASIQDLGYTVFELAALKHATGLSMTAIMGIESALKNNDLPTAQRARRIAQDAAMGKVLDAHMGRIMSAGVFGVPTGVHSAQAVARGQMDPWEAALETGIQGGAGFLLGGGKSEGIAEKPLGIETAPVSGVQGRGGLDADKILAAREAAVGPVGLVPERPAALSAQMEALKAGNRDAVLITPGARRPPVPPGYQTLSTADGILIFDPKVVDARTIRSKVANGTLGELMGHVEPKPLPGEPVTTIVARDPAGNEIQSSAVSPEAAPAQAESLQTQHPQATIETGGNDLAAQVIAERLQEPPHHSQLQPRNDQGQFDGPPESSPTALNQQPEAASPEVAALEPQVASPASLSGHPVPEPPRVIDPATEQAAITTALADVERANTAKDSTALANSLQRARDVGATEDQIASTLKGAAAPKPEESKPTIAPVAEPAPPPESTTSARKSQMAQDRAELDLPDLPPAERKSWQQSLDNARKKGIPQRALAIAKNVLERPHALDDEQTAGLVQRAQQVKNEHAEVMRQIAAESNADTLGDLRAHAEELQGQFDTLSDALKQSGTEKGRALAAQKLTINQDYDLVSLMNRYKQKVGKAPDAEARATIEKQAATIKDLQGRLAERESRLANDQVSRSTERIRRDVARDTRRAQRGAKRADLDAEAARLRDLIAQAWKKSRQPNVQPAGLSGLDPEGEVAKLVLKLVRNRVQANLGIKAEALVDEVHGLLEKVVDIDKRDIREMITSYGKPRQRQSELQRNLNSLKGQLRKGLEDEDIAAGRRSGKPEGPPNVLREIQKRNARLERQIAELERKATESDFGKQAKPTSFPYSDARTQQLTEELSRAKLDYERKLRQWEDTNRSMSEKTADLLIKWGRAAKLSYTSTLGKLGSAATGRMIMSPLENLLGEIPHRLMPELSAKATTEGGGFNRAAEVAALWKSGRMKQVLNQLTKGSSNLDLELGPRSKLIDKEMSGEGILGIPGRAHGALKEYPRQAEFDRAFLKVLKNYERQGQDITQPGTQLAARMEAFNAAERARFQQRNIVSDTFNNAMSSLERKGLAGKLIAKPAKFLFPIVRVPVNVAGETLNYTFGLPRGVIETAIRGGVKNLTPEQANNVMRAYKKGGVGLAMMAYAFLHPEQFGGYYQKHDKRKPSEPKPGEIMFFGRRIPKMLTHIPILEAAQMAATARRVMDGLTKKGEGKVDTAITGAGAALGGVAEGVPFYETPARFFQGKEGSRGAAQLAGEQVRGMIPGFVQEGAKYLDKGPSGEPATRRPSGSFAERFKQTIQLGLPGPYGRSSVPISNVFGTKSTKGSDEVQRLSIPLVGAVRQADESPEDFAKRAPLDNEAVRKGIERVVNLRAYDKLTDEEKVDQIKLAKQEALKEVEHPEKPEKQEKQGLLPDEAPTPPLIRRGLKRPPDPYRRFRQPSP